MNIKTIAFIGLTAILSLTTTVIHAADARFCDQYARKSIQQQVANVAHNCGGTGLRWSPLFVPQRDWCLTVRQPIAENETQARETALTNCGTTSARINWRGLPDAPGVWDNLFAQEMIAIKKDDVVSIQVMHQHGINIHHDEGFNNGTALYHSIVHQAEKVARYLVHQGVNPNQTTNGGVNPLLRMFEKWDPQQRKWVGTKANVSLLQFLLNSGSDPNTFGELNGGILPLQAALDSNQQQAAEILLGVGADPNKHDFGTDSPLVSAIKKRSREAVIFLVNRGANVHMGASGKTCFDTHEGNVMPLDRAQSIGFLQIVPFLRNRGARTNAECLAG